MRSEQLTESPRTVPVPGPKLRALSPFACLMGPGSRKGRPVAGYNVAAAATQHSPFHPPGSWTAKPADPWRMKGRGAVGRSAAALSERSEDIRHRTPERAEGFRWPVVSPNDFLYKRYLQTPHSRPLVATVSAPSLVSWVTVTLPGPPSANVAVTRYSTSAMH